ncbi:Intraflagellar transport protein 74 [Gaertneriomyces sp. JEL0708]|nr:Intraflagellar transport protein 74 [Gaertneriomyces sp. JEL0708]
MFLCGPSSTHTRQNGRPTRHGRGASRPICRPPTGSLANRPASRAAGTAWGRQGPTAGAPPRTVGTRAGMPARPVTGRGGLGMQIAERPMTQHGLGGIKTSTQGPGRMVQDITFYQSELRHRITLLSTEITRLNTEYDTVSKETSNYNTFEQRADTLAEELRELQGQLGDLNTLVDKLHTDTDLEDIERQCNQLKAQNERQTKALDEIFAERQQRVKALADVENEISEEKKKTESKISELGPDRRIRYYELKSENTQYMATVSQMQAELASLQSEASKLSSELSQDSVKYRALTLHEKLTDLQSKKKEHEEQLQMLESESGPQERTRLLAQVRADNQETAAMERKIVELEEQAERFREQSSQIDMELDSTQSEKNAKYEELLKRDRDMQAFIDTFQSRQKEAQEQNRKLEQTIVSIMEEMKTLAKHAELPTPQGFKDLKGDLKLKESEMRNSENTMEAVTQERDRLLGDLEKVNQLESKLSAELQHLNQKLETLQTDILKVSDIDTIRSDLESARERKREEKAQLVMQRDNLRSTINSVMVPKYEAKKEFLHDNETATQLSALEHRLRHVEGTNWHLKDYISSKLAESEYEPVKKEVLSLIEELNQQVMKMSPTIA